MQANNEPRPTDTGPQTYPSGPNAGLITVCFLAGCWGFFNIGAILGSNGCISPEGASASGIAFVAASSSSAAVAVICGSRCFGSGQGSDNDIEHGPQPTTIGATSSGSSAPASSDSAPSGPSAAASPSTTATLLCGDQRQK